MKDYMKGVAVVDVEATSLDTQRGAIASIGMVTFVDGGLNRFYRIFRPFPRAKMDHSALKVNGFSRKDLDNRCDCKGGELNCKVAEHAHDPRKVPLYVSAFMKDNRCSTIAGQNPTFDANYINAYYDRYGTFNPVSWRTIDLHSIAYAKLAEKNIRIPTERIKDRGGKEYLRNDFSATHIYKMIGMPEEPRPHNGLTGAVFEFEALCRIIYKRPVLEEFKKYRIRKGTLI